MEGEPREVSLSQMRKSLNAKLRSSDFVFEEVGID